MAIIDDVIGVFSPRVESSQTAFKGVNHGL